MITKFNLLIIIICFLKSQASVQAEGNFKDLSPVFVHINCKEDLNLTQEIKTKTELTLRKSGVTVVDKWEKAKLHVIIDISVVANKNIDDRIRGYAYSVGCQAMSYAIIEGKTKPTLVTIWQSKGYIGIAPPHDLYVDLKNCSNKLAEEFTNLYLKANNK